MKFAWALAIECAGIALIIGCSLTPLPYVSSVTGTATDVVWNQAGEPNYLAIGTEYFLIPSSVAAAAPAPTEGEEIRVDFLDHAAGSVVLDLVVTPGRSTATRYVTSDGRGFEAQSGLHNAALGGLLGGVVLAVIGFVLVIRIGRRVGAPAGAIAVAVSPLSTLALVDLLGRWEGLPALAAIDVVASLIWIAAAIVALVAALYGRRHDEQPAYARGALWFVSITNGVWLAWWAGAAISAFNRSMY